MRAMVARRCRHCEVELLSRALYFRFAVALEGELDVLDAGSPELNDPSAIVAAAVARGDETADLEDGVHWEASGVLCPSCRASLMDWLGSPRLVRPS